MFWAVWVGVRGGRSDGEGWFACSLTVKLRGERAGNERKQRRAARKLDE